MSQTYALRLYGKNDLRLESFDLPAIADDEILADITTNSICMSTYKAMVQGGEHKRVPDNIADKPTSSAMINTMFGRAQASNATSPRIASFRMVFIAVFRECLG